MNVRRPVFFVSLSAAVVALLCLFHVPLLQSAMWWLDVGQPCPAPASYVMVLNGGEYTRPFAAAALVKEGLARRALVATVAEHVGDRDPTVPPYHEINHRVLVQRGIAEGDITLLPIDAATTRDEAAALAGFLQLHPNATVIVVTNDFHTRRSRWIFSRILGERAAQTEFFSAPSDDFDEAFWWRSEAGFVTVGTEYLKLAAYIVCYGHFFHWVAACLILAFVSHYARQREAAALAGR